MRADSFAVGDSPRVVEEVSHCLGRRQSDTRNRSEQGHRRRLACEADQFPFDAADLAVECSDLLERLASELEEPRHNETYREAFRRFKADRDQLIGRELGPKSRLGLFYPNNSPRRFSSCSNTIG